MFSSRGTVRYEERGQGYHDVEKVGKHWFRRTEQKAPGYSEADGSLQTCGSAVWNWLHVNLLAPSMWGFLGLWSLVVTLETADRLSWNLARTARWSIHIPAFYCSLYWSWRSAARGEILTTICFLWNICKNTERSYTHDCAECNEQHGRRVQSVFSFFDYRCGWEHYTENWRVLFNVPTE